MTYKTRVIEEFSLPLPITETARAIAQKFAAGQPTPEKVEQVRLNTLAVCVVNYYLEMIGITTDITVGDSWNPVVRLAADVADLEVTDIGRLECRPIRADQENCYIPPEVWSDRIGYVVVEFDELLREAKVLGFIQTAATEYIAISELQPIENLCDRLSQLQQPVEVIHELPRQGITCLSQWLENVFDTSWQTIEALLGSTQTNLAFSFRRNDNSQETSSQHHEASVRRAKLIDLGLQLAGHSVALIVELRQVSPQKTDILIQVHPTGSQTYLQPLLQLIVLDESEEIFLEAQARSADNYIQLQFSGKPKEKFSVKVALGDVSITENFVI
ncbi:MAG: DUF1822 family protein [Gloeocapsa sp. UFS-A4-WI-NPMV-4B04]|jgi:hypothetical protein|nr:DUF1822 family protein [Gloeocapsa sp. UFS-A4-WI-NPMV-4B04]